MPHLHFAALLASEGVENAAFVAVENILTMASRFDTKSFDLAASTYGSIHDARQLTV